MFPLGIAIPITLAIARQRRAATAWTVALLSVWAAMLALKLIGYAAAAAFPASPFRALDLLTPSGHVASAAAIYGGLAGLLLPRPGTLRQRCILAAIAIAFGIGTTRVLLGLHSLAEVTVGAAVGIAGAAAIARWAGTPAQPRARLPVLAVALLILVARHGDHTSWEESIRAVALRLTHALTAHP